MKAKERDEARRMRSEEGLSVGEIARRLGVSKGTSSAWVRDVEMNDAQHLRLLERSKKSPGQLTGSKLTKEVAQKKREEYQQAGRDWVHMGHADNAYRLLCALYWAEGSKDRNVVGMTNTDSDMLKIFVNALKKDFHVKDEDFTVTVMAHLNNGLTAEKIQCYWLKTLGLPASCLRKFTLKTKYFPEQNKKQNRHVYGGCTVRVCSTEIVQRIYGSIQEIFKIDRPEWLWG